MKNTVKILSIFLSATVLTFADNENFDGLTISGKDILGGSYKNSSWIGSTIKSTTFTGTKFNESNFSTAKIRESNFEHVDISNSIFDEAELNIAKFTGSTAKNTSFKKAKMTYGSVVFTSGIFDGSDFSEAVLSMSYRDTSYSASFENSSLIGANFSKAKLINGFLTLPYEAKVWRTSSVNFSGADLTGANFSDTTLAITTNNYQGKTVNFSGATLKSVNFTNAILGSYGFGLNLAGTDLSSCNFTNAALNRVWLSDSVITNVNFSNARKLTTSQLSETKNYKSKNLSGIKFNGLDLTDWDLSGQNLQYTSFNGANLTGVNARYADLRGSDLTDITGSLKTQNTIWTDGEIKNFSMSSVEDNFSIRKYVPATTGGAMINAKITNDASISGGAVLTLEEGAVLEVSAGKTLTVSDNGEIVFDVDAATDDTNIILNNGSKLVFGDNSKFTINLTGEVSETDPLNFTVVKAADDSYVLGLDTLPKDNIILNVNGTAYDTGKWGINFDPTTGNLDINVNVPEPASCALALGALAIAFAFMRRRR